jgi:hypothetical protein
MGLLASSRRPNWYDAGRFWSGDDLGLSAGFSLGGEIAVAVPASQPGAPLNLPDTCFFLVAKGRQAGGNTVAIMPWSYCLP